MGSVNVQEVKTAEEFQQILKDTGSAVVAVHFWADWAPQCTQISEVLQEMSKDGTYKQCMFVKVEAESVPEVSQKYKITAVPTCLLLKNGVEVERVNGANVPELKKKLDQQLAKPTEPAPLEDLNTRLKKLINKAPVMMFMKGHPDEPRCGFSKQMIQLLGDQKVTYDTFDILTDPEVRQGLKEFSQWPTYPQLYIKGELVGGLDIVKELIETGEFKDQLPKEASLDDRLKALVNQEKVMLFMKGNPDEPRCGFSKTTTAILKDTGVTFGHFDILQDETVRQGLKTYSNWPTYPQLYVKGDLIGGLDIIKELQESGELADTLKGE